MGYKLFFVESICEDEATIEANIRFVCLLSRKAKASQKSKPIIETKFREVKVTSPDYVAMGDKVIQYELSNAIFNDLNVAQFHL